MTQVPSFSLSDQNGKVWTKDSLKGSWTVLYAYPKDMTSGCTLEAHDFSLKRTAFQKIGAEIIGISPDDISQHQKFCEKESIPFPLLSDPQKDLLSALGVWKEKSLYGRKYMGVERTTWIISPEGKIVKTWEKVKVPGHVEEVYESLKSLQLEK